MKQFFLSFIALFLSFQFYAQIQGPPPPPCGITPVYVCDDNNDGFEEFNLRELFPFTSFCAANQGEIESDYHPISYYETIEDMNNETNAIANPEAYVNISNPQIIYYRANAVNPGGNFDLLTSVDNFIEIKRLSDSIEALKICDDDHDGFGTFDLTQIETSLFCNSIPNNYSISYYEDHNLTNLIVDPTNFESNTQEIYAEVEYLDTGYKETTSFGIVVSPSSLRRIHSLSICDGSNNDGIEIFDLTATIPELTGGLTGVVVTFHYTEIDAINNVNAIAAPSTFVNSANPQTMYVRVENSIGCFEIDSFDLEVRVPPTINQPTPLEVCDDSSNDGIEVFDLTAKTPEIIGGLTDVTVTYYEAQSDADSKINEVFPYTYTVLTYQTIYARVDDMVTGCYSITTLDLIVYDCSTKGVIEINAFYDEDENATFENDEINFLNGVLSYEKNNDGILRNLYSSNGIFSIISEDENDTYDISYSILNDYDACYDITTASYENISVSNGRTVNYNFPVTKTSDCGDIAVYLISYVPPRPGFDYRNYLVVQNRGLETVASGTIEFTMDANLTLTSVTGVDTGNTITNTASGFNLNFVNLAPNESEVVYVNMNVPIPTPLGTLLTNSASYSVTDLSLDNNTTSLTETVIGSYDPNDINESHGPDILHSSFSSDDYLFYTIRFQNVGTADAINVSIDNTLDSQLDASTIQMLSSSHTNVFTRTGSQLNWQFDNIHLPSEDDDEPNSHGYVYYKIKPKAGYTVGDVIPNTAEIYFDFNPAVITNTFETEFTSLLSAKFFNKNDVALYPNPAQDEVKLTFNRSFNDSVLIKIYNIQGEQVVKEYKNFDANSLLLNVKGLSKGVYFLQANFDGNEIVKKIVIN